MAQLDPDEQNEASNLVFNQLLWSASHVLTIGIISKFAAGFRRQNRTKNTASEYSVRQLVRSISQKSETILHFANSGDENSNVYREISLILLRKQLSDSLHELHQQLLTFEIDDIVEVIPLVDQLRKFWQPDIPFRLHLAELEHYHVVVLRMEQKLKQSDII